MNTKSKKVAVATVAAACTLTIGAMALTACGGTDWTKYKYDDFAKITEADWNAKTIAHQFVDSLEGHGTNGMGSWYCLVNLYEDGSMVYLQGFDTGDKPDSWIWGIEEYNVRWINYGYWEESDGNLETAEGDKVDEGNLLLTYTHYWDDDFDDDSKKDVWCQTEAWKEGSGYTIKANSLQLWFMGQDNGGNDGVCDVELKDSGTVKYATWSAWYDAWKANVKTGGGPGGQPPADESSKDE